MRKTIDKYNFGVVSNGFGSKLPDISGQKKGKNKKKELRIISIM